MTTDDELLALVENAAAYYGGREPKNVLAPCVAIKRLVERSKRLDEAEAKLGRATDAIETAWYRIRDDEALARDMECLQAFLAERDEWGLCPEQDVTRGKTADDPTNSVATASGAMTTDKTTSIANQNGDT